MKRLLYSALAILLSSAAFAQTKWYNPLESGAEVYGQGWPELNGTYWRLPDKAKANVREAVWKLSRNDAGLSIAFRSNARTMQIRYQVTGGQSMFHMPSTGVSGVDLYVRDNSGKQHWVAEDFVPTFKDTIVYRYSHIDYPEGQNEYEFRLYLPTYNTIKWMEIGVPEDADITFLGNTDEKPIVFYGTSIAQGACSSRPGMAWTNIVERELNHQTVNLGFSGNGRLEKALFDLMSEIDAAAYVIDCLPNMNPGDKVDSLVVAGVHTLRAAHDCPIILVEHMGRPGTLRDGTEQNYEKLNDMQKKGYAVLKKEKCKNIYYITTEDLGLDLDSTVENVHPNDLGMRHYADALEKVLRKCLAK